MNVFSAYAIPIQGLKIGVHHFHYSIDGAFFRLFEDSPIDESAINFEVILDKRSDMLLLAFALTGTVRAECDRCTAQINLPIQDQRELIVKYGEVEEEEENDEVVFISREASHLNLAKYLYEFSILALPITNTFNCQALPEPPCNFEILNFLQPEDAADTPDSVWDALRDLDKNN